MRIIKKEKKKEELKTRKNKKVKKNKKIITKLKMKIQ
jgi:hypothetical protein